MRGEHVDLSELLGDFASSIATHVSIASFPKKWADVYIGFWGNQTTFEIPKDFHELIVLTAGKSQLTSTTDDLYLRPVT